MFCVPKGGAQASDPCTSFNTTTITYKHDKEFNVCCTTIAPFYNPNSQTCSAQKVTFGRRPIGTCIGIAGLGGVRLREIVIPYNIITELGEGAIVTLYSRLPYENGHNWLEVEADIEGGKRQQGMVAAEFFSCAEN